MNRCLRAVLVITALACSSISCQGTVEGLSSVGGKVLCNGEPAAGAVLVFHRRDGASSLTSNTSQVIPTAVVQDDGTFAVESAPLGYGALPGTYVVLAQWPQDIGAAQPTSTGIKEATTSVRGKKVVIRKHTKLSSAAPDRLKGRYMDVSKPLLKTEVKPGSNDLGTLELSLNP